MARHHAYCKTNTHKSLGAEKYCPKMLKNCHNLIRILSNKTRNQAAIMLFPCHLPQSASPCFHSLMQSPFLIFISACNKQQTKIFKHEKFKL